MTKLLHITEVGAILTHRTTDTENNKINDKTTTQTRAYTTFR